MGEILWTIHVWRRLKWIADTKHISTSRDVFLLIHLMEEYTLDEAVRHANYVSEVLSLHKIPPYAFYEAGAKVFVAHDTTPPFHEAQGVYAMVDVNDASSQDAPVGKHLLPNLVLWQDPDFLRLVCGLLEHLPHSWHERIAEWEWTAPAKWKEERVQWRRDKYALINASELDVMRKICKK